jgi:hypothetical protein
MAKYNRGTSWLEICLFCMAVRTTDLRNFLCPRSERWSVIYVKSCNVLLRMLLACSRGYLNSVLRHKLLILHTYHPDTLYIREQGCENPWLFPEARRGPRTENLGKIWSRRYSDSVQTGWPGDRIPVRARFSAPFQTGRIAHLVSYAVGTEYFSRN